MKIARVEKVNSVDEEILYDSRPIEKDSSAEQQVAKDNSVKTSIVTVRASDVRPKPLEWMYPDRFLFRKVNLICGPPDVGKDSVVIDLIARATTGTDWPDRKNSHEAFDVILFASEDGLDDTVVPRLMVAGADLGRVHFAKQTEIERNAKKAVRSIALDQDIAAIKKMLAAIPARLLVISPLGSYLGSIKKNSDDHVRPLLDALTQLAEETGVAILVISHFNKNVLQSAIDRTGGAGAIGQVPRCAWSFVKDLDDETGESRLMLSVKLNAVREDRKTGLRYRFTEELLSIGGKLVGYPRIQWLGASTRKIDDVLHATVDTEGGKLSACMTWLKEFLADGPQRAIRVYEAGDARGFSPATVKRARSRAHIRSEQRGDGWWNELPSGAQDQPCGDTQ
jgi:AAA domain